MNKISFNGTFIHKRNIKQRIDNRYIPVKSSFIELNPNDFNDLKTLSNIDKNWNSEFSSTIYQSALSNKSLINTNKKYYALTIQKDNFQTLDYKKILGLAEFENKEDLNKIVLLQVNPKYINNNPHQKSLFSKIFTKIFRTKNSTLPLYKNIGRGILDSFKEISDKSLELFALNNTKDFYKKNGFKNPFNLNYFIWIKKLCRQ